MKPGDYAFNVRTGECRLVVEVSLTSKEVTFSGSQRWESVKDWRGDVRPTFQPREVKRGD